MPTSLAREGELYRVSTDTAEGVDNRVTATPLSNVFRNLLRRHREPALYNHVQKCDSRVIKYSDRDTRAGLDQGWVSPRETQFLPGLAEETRRNRFLLEETRGRQTHVYRPMSAMMHIITVNIDLLPCYMFQSASKKHFVPCCFTYVHSATVQGLSNNEQFSESVLKLLPGYDYTRS